MTAAHLVLIGNVLCLMFQFSCVYYADDGLLFPSAESARSLSSSAASNVALTVSLSRADPPDQLPGTCVSFTSQCSEVALRAGGSPAIRGYRRRVLLWLYSPASVWLLPRDHQYAVRRPVTMPQPFNPFLRFRLKAPQYPWHRKAPAP